MREARSEPRLAGAVAPKSRMPPAPSLISVVTSPVDVSSTGTAIVIIARRLFGHLAISVSFVQTRPPDGAFDDEGIDPAPAHVVSNVAEAMLTASAVSSRIVTTRVAF